MQFVVKVYVNGLYIRENAVVIIIVFLVVLDIIAEVTDSQRYKLWSLWEISFTLKDF